MERTLILLKPDAIQRSLTGSVIARLEARGLKIAGMKLMQMTNELAHRHYEAHVGKPFFDGLVKFITSGPIAAIILEGNNAVEVVRNTMGATDPSKAGPGTIRGDLAIDIGRNLIHGSDSLESAQREIDLFFNPTEMLSYSRDTDRWITES
jgi:nucleoside-diphosphate kinase